MSKKKKSSHASFRNGHLFCYHCGASYDQQLPQPVMFAAAVMKAFSAAHKHCEKTWVQPEVDQSLAAPLKAMWWKNGMNGERGTSSEAMWQVFNYCHSLHNTVHGAVHLPTNLIGLSHPHDPNDFRRCYLLLKTVPEWKTHLHHMKKVSRVWSNLVDNWDKLTEMLETAMKENKPAPEMYELMKSLGC